MVSFRCLFCYLAITSSPYLFKVSTEPETAYTPPKRWYSREEAGCSQTGREHFSPWTGTGVFFPSKLYPILPRTLCFTDIQSSLAQNGVNNDLVLIRLRGCAFKIRFKFTVGHEDQKSLQITF